MKRFFCTTCKRVKRVRYLPSLSPLARITNEDGDFISNPNIAQREGSCIRHIVKNWRKR